MCGPPLSLFRQQTPLLPHHPQNKTTANPAFFETTTPYVLPAMSALAVEVWTTTGGLRMDNFVVGHDAAAALKFAQTAWKRECAVFVWVFCQDGRADRGEGQVDWCFLIYIYNHWTDGSTHAPVISIYTHEQTTTAKYDAEVKQEEAAIQVRKSINKQRG